MEVAMKKFEEALKKARQAECNAVAELMDECIGEDPHVVDENGNPMTRDQVIQAMRDDWKKHYKDEQ